MKMKGGKSEDGSSSEEDEEGGKTARTISPGKEILRNKRKSTHFSAIDNIYTATRTNLTFR